MLIKAFINNYRTVHEDIGSLSYTVFIIDVYVDGVMHVIERRYSEFEDLHKILKKQMNVPAFPPKKVLNKSSKVIEERRVQLEAYIQEILLTQWHTGELLTFLAIDNHTNGEQLGDSVDDLHSSGVTSVREDAKSQLTMSPFIKSSDSSEESGRSDSRDTSPDIILQGIYQALYAT